MYMNCAPITVIGNNQSVMAGEPNASFPPLFIANINGCNTTEMVAIRFPEPGKFIETPPHVISLAGEDEPPCTGIPTSYYGLHTEVAPSTPLFEDTPKTITSDIASSTLYTGVTRIPNCCCR
jgi:hypothetical protein